jgi:Zn-dependent protease with chaperone function
MAENIEKKYRVVFRGELEQSLDIDVVKKNLAQLFKTTPERVEKLFTGKQVTLNNNLDEISAQNYASELLTAGAVCIVEPMPEPPPKQEDNTSKSSQAVSTGRASAMRATLTKGFESLTTKIAPTVFPKLYMAGWILSASGMLFLFCFYIFIIMFAASWLFDHTADNITYIDDLPIILGFLAYIIPIILGLLFIAALLKPFIAPPVVKRFSVPLSRKKEPALFIFVEKLCRSIGPEIPTEIEIDYAVDTTASYRGGIISFLEDKMTLTIGLPVVSEMTVEEFAGLLAHEFAHFTEKTTTRLYYVITNVNTWFAHAVFDQDLVDAKLTVWEETASKLYIRLPISFLKLFVWVTRKICTGLMFAGHGISRYYVRQMELEADRFAARMIGSEVFESATYKIHIINRALKDAFLQIKKMKSQNDTSLPDNFIQLISSIRSQLTEEEIASAKEYAAIPKTGMFDSHPTDLERIAKVKSSKIKGMFQSDRPTTSLFSNFDEIVKLTSARYYRESLRLRFDQSSLISTQDFLAIPESDQVVDIAKPDPKSSDFGM